MSTLGTEVDFRGAKREVEFEYEGDGIIIWWFTYDGGDSGQSDATEAEHSDIYQQLWAYLEDWWAGQDDYPA